MKKSNVSGKVKYLFLVLVYTVNYCNISFMFQRKKSAKFRRCRKSVNKVSTSKRVGSMVPV